MAKGSNINVIDKQEQTFLMISENEMIPRGFKWVKASEEGYDIYYLTPMDGKIKFWMIISIMRVVKYVCLFASLFA